MALTASVQKAADVLKRDGKTPAEIEQILQLTPGALGGSVVGVDLTLVDPASVSGTFTFTIPGTVIEIRPAGEFRVNGDLVETDRDLYLAFVAFFKDSGHYP